MSILNKPYPKNGNPKRKFIFAICFGMFIFLFLLLFQPFGLNEWRTPNKTLKLAGYGLISALMIMFNGLVIERLFRNWFLEKNWTVGKEILSAICNILVIGTCNLMYTHFLGVARLDIMNFVNFQWITLIIGIIPITLITVLNQSRLQKLNLEGARQLNEMIEHDVHSHPSTSIQENITLWAENGKDKLVIEPSSLLVVVSADNYVEIYHSQHNKVKKDILRCSLKSVDALLAHNDLFFRCHRSYLVNLSRVEKVSGNSQGYKLHIPNLDFQIPVSRSLHEKIRLNMETIHSIHPI